MIIKIEQHSHILELLKSTSQKTVAELYKVSQSTISNICKQYGVHYSVERLNFCRKKCDFNYFLTIDSNEKAYWLGYICADGCILKNYKIVNLISKDKEVIENFKKAIRSEHNISHSNKIDKRTNKKYERYSISINGREFRENLINLGVTSNKTDKLEMPNIEEKYYPYFFAGLFDGDGSVQQYADLNKEKQETHHFGRPLKMDKCRISLISTLEILLFLQTYLMKNNNIETLKMSKVSKNKSNVWKMYLYKDAKKFLDWIYQDPLFPYLQRKYLKYQAIKNGENLLCQIKLSS